MERTEENTETETQKPRMYFNAVIVVEKNLSVCNWTRAASNIYIHVYEQYACIEQNNNKKLVFLFPLNRIFWLCVRLFFPSSSFVPTLYAD